MEEDLLQAVISVESAIQQSLESEREKAAKWLESVRVSLSRGRLLFRELRERLPASLLPRYVVDLPDGSGKVPVEELQPTGPGGWRYVHPDGLVSELEER